MYFSVFIRGDFSSAKKIMNTLTSATKLANLGQDEITWIDTPEGLNINFRTREAAEALVKSGFAK